MANLDAWRAAMRKMKYQSIVLGASLLLATSGAAQSGSATLVETTYQVNVKGITVLDIKYAASISATTFRSEASVSTRGMVSLFSDYLMELETTGQFERGSAIPARHVLLRERNDKRKKTEITWSGGYVTKGVLGKDAEVQAEIEMALTANAADALTAVLRVGRPNNSGPCRTTQRIFDGKEVFDLQFNFKRAVELEAVSRGAYEGSAFECEVIYVPVAGKYASKFRSRNEEPPHYKVWLAPLARDPEGNTLLVPVRASGKLEGLKFVAETSHINLNGRAYSKLLLK